MDKPRPAPEKRSRRIWVSVSDSEHACIVRYAEQAGVSRSALLRAAVLNPNWADLLTDAFLRALREWICQLQQDGSHPHAIELLHAAVRDAERLSL